MTLFALFTVWTLALGAQKQQWVKVLADLCQSKHWYQTIFTPIVAFTCTRAQKSHFPKNILDEIVEISTFITVQPLSML